MNGFFQSIGVWLTQWGQLPLSRRVASLASLLVGIGVFAGLLYWATSPNFVPLMTNLTQEDAAQIVERLQREHINYRLENGGTAILVAQEEVYETRLSMAGAGLPRSGNVGFEIFDEPNFGMSRFAEQLNYRRALEGELRRTIRQFDVIHDARVHIVMPEAALFRDHEQHATAAVTLQLQPGRVLSAAQTRAIVHLVSSSVAGLSPERVTLVDNTGTILARGGETGGDFDRTLEHQHAIERSLQERVQQILVPIVGEGHVVVRVSATLDYSRVDKTSETYEPQSVALRSEQTSQEHSAGSSSAQQAKGIPGSRSNLAGLNKTNDAMSADNSSAAATPASHDKHHEIRNYEINKIVAHETGQLGRLARLSVAVLVDGVNVTAADGSKKIQERSQEEMTRIGELVRRAVGYDADRDDQISVQSMLFETPAAPVELQPEVLPSWLPYVEHLWRPVLSALVILVLLVGTMRWLSSSRSVANAEFAVLDGRPRTVRELEAAMGGGVSAMPLAAERVPALPATAVAAEPKQAADVLKGWLNEA